MTQSIHITTLEETAELAQSIITPEMKGQVFLLSGDLGAGKTTFTQNIAKALGITHHIQSPTFTLFKVYPIPQHPHLKYLCHIDAYRLDESSNLADLGLDDYINASDTLTVIEWPQRIPSIIKNLTLPQTQIDISLGKSINERIFTIKKEA
jgi:tRNA threonylcarbamoyladenosine biosynthesis protein TsaE